MTSSGTISFYVDTLLVETVLSDPRFYKKAGFVGDLLSRVKDYFASKIDKDHPVASVLNELAPGAVAMLFSSLGLGMWGTLAGLLMSVFHVNVMGILSSLYEKVKGWISGGGQVSSAQVDQAVDQVAADHAGEASQQEAQQGYQALQQQQQQQGAHADDGKVYSSLELLEDSRMIRLAMIEFERQNMRLTKQAIDLSDFLSGYSKRKATGTSLIAKIFGWVIKLALSAAGLMVAGDVINALFGRPSSLTGTYQAGHEDSGGGSAPSGHQSTQTKYKLKGDAPIPEQMPLQNNPQNIENMIIQFAKDVYSGLDGKENLIRSTPGFQVIKEKIAWANAYNPGSRSIIIPPAFTTKKQLVDFFIDDVAAQDK